MFPLKFFTAALLAGATTLAQAGFTILGTRVIYDEADREATVQLQRSSGTKPVLLQVWLDDGSPDAKPGEQDLPFVLTPAVSRVDAGGAQVVRILRTREAGLPADRETLLFFNALEVPAAQAAKTGDRKNSIQFAMQARMKFFYRPQGLPVSPAQASELLDFALVKSQASTPEAALAAPLSLRIHNPTPYHITVPELALHEDGTVDAQAAATLAVARLPETALAPMVAPYSDLVVPLELLAHHLHASALPQRLMVHYRVINDQGGLNAKVTELGDAA